MEKYFLILDYNNNDKITTAITHSHNNTNGKDNGYWFAYTYVVPWDLYRRKDIVWTSRQLFKLKRNLDKHNKNRVFKKLIQHKVKILN